VFRVEESCCHDVGFSGVCVGLLEAWVWGPQVLSYPSQQHYSSLSLSVTLAIQLPDSSPTWMEGSIHRDAGKVSPQVLEIGVYFIILFVMYIEMRFSLSYLDGKNFCLTEFAVLVSISLASDAEIMYGSDGRIGRCSAIMRGAWSRTVGCIVSHNDPSGAFYNVL